MLLRRQNFNLTWSMDKIDSCHASNLFCCESIFLYKKIVKLTQMGQSLIPSVMYKPQHLCWVRVKSQNAKQKMQKLDINTTLTRGPIQADTVQ